MSAAAAPAAGTTSTAAPEVPIRCTQLFINNEWRDAKSGRSFASINPATEETIAMVQEAGVEDVDDAVKAAHAAFQPDSAWRKLDPHERGALLSKLADLVERDGAYIANLEALDNGKPVKMALLVDVGTAVRMLRYHAGWPDKITGSTLPTAGGGLTYTRHDPVGVVSAILPFNFPMLGMVTKMAPALCAGACRRRQRCMLVGLCAALLLRPQQLPSLNSPRLQGARSS